MGSKWMREEKGKEKEEIEGKEFVKGEGKENKEGESEGEEEEGRKRRDKNLSEGKRRVTTGRGRIAR